MRALMKTMVMPVLRVATSSYVAGKTLDEAASLAERAAARDLTCTLCFWNGPTDEPDVVEREYARILNLFGTRQMNGLLAVKLPALHERWEPVERLISLARSVGSQIIFDAHQRHQSDDTFRVLERLGGGNIGLAIPGRWHRSIADADRAVEMGVRVRVVKGEFPDPDNPDTDLREGYLRVIRRLAGRAAFVGVATHDAPLAAKAMEILAEAGTPFEQEFVYPLPVEAAMREGRRFGAKARLYIPYGEAWLPYSLKRAFRNPKTFYWLARDLAVRNKFVLPQPVAS